MIEAAGLPAERWRGGAFDVGDYIIEARGVGIYETVEVTPAMVSRDGDAVLQHTDDDGVIIAERRVVDR